MTKAPGNNAFYLAIRCPQVVEVPVLNTDPSRYPDFALVGLEGLLEVLVPAQILHAHGRPIPRAAENRESEQLSQGCQGQMGRGLPLSTRADALSM